MLLSSVLRHCHNTRMRQFEIKWCNFPGSIGQVEFQERSNGDGRSSVSGLLSFTKMYCHTSFAKGAKNAQDKSGIELCTRTLSKKFSELYICELAPEQRGRKIKRESIFPRFHRTAPPLLPPPLLLNLIQTFSAFA